MEFLFDLLEIRRWNRANSIPFKMVIAGVADQRAFGERSIVARRANEICIHAMMLFV